MSFRIYGFSVGSKHNCFSSLCRDNELDRVTGSCVSPELCVRNTHTHTHTGEERVFQGSSSTRGLWETATIRDNAVPPVKQVERGTPALAGRHLVRVAFRKSS